MSNEMTIDNLYKAGYKRYGQNLEQATLYQKRIGKTDYFINVSHWIFHIKQYTTNDKLNKVERFDAEVQFKNSSGQVFNLSLLHPKTIDECEKFFANAYKVLKCEPYEKD